MRHGLPYAAFVALGLALTTPALAVSVGDIRPQSRAGEPLSVKIAIVDSDGIADNSIQITPATAADHALLGMQRPVWLDQMVFTTERDADGQLQVLAQSAIVPPANEQSFLVQLSWPGHVRLQQVSVSLPAANSAPEVPSSVALSLPDTPEATTVIPAQPAVADVAPTQPIATVIPTQPKAVPAPVIERPTQSRSGALTVRPGDTLSQIASEWDQDLSLNQRQQIIRERNPKAFVNGNINRLRANVRISLPDPSSITVPSERSADRWYSQALKQAQGLLKPDLKKPLVSAAVPAAEALAAEANVTLIAPGSSDATDAGSSGAGNASGDDATASALIEADSQRNDQLSKRLQLRERLAELTQTNADSDKRLTLLDERLAAMERGEAPVVVADDTEADAAAPTSDDENAWLWWSAAGLFWLILLVVWLRQRQTSPMPEAERTAPVVATETPAPIADEPPSFDDTFASLQPDSASLASYSAADAQADEAEEEYDFLSDSDAEAYQTRIDLAQAYLDMNEDDAARQLLQRVMEGGTSEQRARAKTLLDSIA